MNIIDIIFIFTLIALAFIPKKGKYYLIWFLFFASNLIVRVYLINDGHKKTTRIKELESLVKQEKYTIRNFESTVSLTISGEWEEGQEPDKLHLMSPVDNNYYISLRTALQNSTNEIIFYGIERHSYTKGENGQIVFRSRSAVKCGDYPIDKSINILETYKYIIIWLPMIRQKNILGKDILLMNGIVYFYINGNLSKEMSLSGPTKIYLSERDYARLALTDSTPFKVD